MSLDDLLETIKTLRGRISAHGDLLRQDEMRTRYALIDPLLGGLSWDTDDPTQVIPEYRSDAGKADYALLGLDGRPVVIVEAKKLGTPLRDAVRQVINYCTEDGFDYFAVTDGQHWELYETHRRGNLAEKMVTSLDLATSPAEMCLRALALWRPSVLEGHLQGAVVPVLGVQESDSPAEESEPPRRWPGPERAATFDEQGLDSIAQDRRSQTRPDEPVEVWMALGSLIPRDLAAPPSEVRFLDGSTLSLSTRWNATIIEVTKWIEAQGALATDRLPLRGGRKRHILAKSPRHESGRQFDNDKRFGDVYLEANGNFPQLHGKLLKIIDHAGMDPAAFQVRVRIKGQARN